MRERLGRTLAAAAVVAMVSVPSTALAAASDVDGEVVGDAPVAGEALVNGTDSLSGGVAAGATDDPIVSAKPSAVDEAAPGDATGVGSGDEADAGEAAGSETEAVTGVYEVASAVNQGKNLDVAGGSSAAKAKIDVWSDNSTKAQRFRFEAVEGTPYSTIYNVGSGLVLDVKEGVAQQGTAVQQYAANGSDAQKWEVAANEDGSYTFFSVLRTALGERLALDVPAAKATNGNALRVWTYNGTAAQRWYLKDTRTVADGVYTISSAVTGDKVLDIAGASSKSKANAQIYTYNATLAQLYYAKYNESTGYYAIQSVNSGLVLDVAGGSKKSGANVQQYKENGTFAQAWSIDPIGGTGAYQLVSGASGLVLDVAGGKSANGTNVRQYKANGTKAQRWYLDSGDISEWLKDGRYTIATAANASYLLDDASGKRTNYANIQVYRGNGSDAQRYEIVRLASGYSLVRNVRSGKYLTLGGDSPKSNAYQLLVDGEPSDSQLWRIGYDWLGFSFVSKNGLVLDVAGARYANGTNVQGYQDNGSMAQRFRLHGASASSLGITDLAARITDASGGTSSVYSQLVGEDVYLFLPSNADLASLSLGVWNPAGGGTVLVSASRGGGYVSYSSGEALDLTQGYVQEESGAYRLFLKPDGATAPTLVHVMRSSNVSAMYLTSSDPSTEGRAFVEASKDHSAKTTGSMVLVDAEGNVSYDGELTQIKGRGNSTWNMSKRPYQIKLAKKTSLIDGTKGNKAKTWVLLANAGDPTLMRNYLTDEVAQALGLDETPESMFVDLYYDGEYRGSYLLSEKVEINGGRVDIDEIENSSTDSADIEEHATARATNAYGNELQYVKGVVQPADITGGYLLELDQAFYAKERSWFTVKSGSSTFHFVLKSPEDASLEEVRYISEKVQRAFDHQNLSDVADYFDLDRLARVFLVEELAKNPDYIKGSSTYFYVEQGGQLVNAGPVWDFDDGYGIQATNWLKTWDGVAMTSPKGLTSAKVAVALDNKLFRQKVTEIFNAEVKEIAATLIGSAGDATDGVESVMGVRQQLADSQAMNQAVWGLQSKSRSTMYDTYQENVDYLRSWLEQRVAWLDSYFNSSEWV